MEKASTFNVLHQESETKGRFYITDETGRALAESTYSKAGDTRLIIDHTEVNDSIRGSGAGLALVEAAVAHARKQNKKILPLCPFANSVFKKHQELQDVL